MLSPKITTNFRKKFGKKILIKLKISGENWSMGLNLEILLTSIIVATSCSLLGVFLVLKGMSMIVNGITHTILLGIVIGFLITNDLNSPLSIVGGSLVGLATVYIINLLSVGRRLMNGDSAIGVITPFFFSVAIILISRFADNTNLSIDSVLVGEIIFVPLNRIMFLGRSVPKNLLISSIILLINIFVIFIFYKELKISTFDKLLSFGFGFSPIILNYIFMTLVSTTIVGSFESVGAILIISFMVGPAISAYLLFDNLELMILASIFIGGLSSILGFFISIHFDLSISGTTATTIGGLFLLILLFSPKKGIIQNIINEKNKKSAYLLISVLIFLYQTIKIQGKNGINLEEISENMDLDAKDLLKIIKKSKEKNYVMLDKDKVKITDVGMECLQKYFS